MRGFNYKKAVQALVFFSSFNGNTLNKMKAIKLIWLADRYHLRKYGRTITNDLYFALPFGPIPSTTRDILEFNNLNETERKYAEPYIQPYYSYHYKTIHEIDEKVFSKTDLEALKLIQENYGHLNHFGLSDLSHTFPEWSKYQSAFDSGISSRFEIKMEVFFENVDDGYGLFEDTEEDLALSKEMYSEYSDAYSIF